MKLTWSDVTKKDDNEFWIIAKRTKTKTDSHVLLLPPALKIINQYKDDPRCADTGRLLPKLSNQKMNAYLKEIAQICGLNTKLHWYVARHTFATTVTLNNGIPIEVVSYMMGHSTTKQTQHYARIKEKMVSKHMKILKEMY
jgi:site-specific recombinase XerD